MTEGCSEKCGEHCFEIVLLWEWIWKAVVNSEVSIRVIFHPAFISLLAKDYRNGAKIVCQLLEMAPKS